MMMMGIIVVVPFCVDRLALVNGFDVIVHTIHHRSYPLVSL